MGLPALDVKVRLEALTCGPRFIRLDVPSSGLYVDLLSMPGYSW